MSGLPKERALSFPMVWRDVGDARELAARIPAPLTSCSPTDEELMDRLKAKEPAALDLLFDRYCRLVFGVALRILNDRGEAEDVVQEAFLYFYRKAVLFDGHKGPARSWIVQVTFHKAFDKRSICAEGIFIPARMWSLLDDVLLGETDLDHENWDETRLRAAQRDFFGTFLKSSATLSRCFTLKAWSCATLPKG